MAPSSSSSSRNWVYDVFPSFSGEDVRVTFLSHLLKELDRKLIIAFKDNEIKRSRSLDPELKLGIKDSRVAVVVFSKNYASSSWCLNELLEIVKCKEEFGQIVIPVFYGLDPSHVRKQTGDFGNIFEETCKNKTEEVKTRWRRALTDVANILGYHSVKWGNEATMIEAIANDVLGKLLLTLSNDFENFVGIEDHIAQMSVLLNLESEQVRMVGIWGSSGIGKTTIARVLFNRLSRHFQGSVYIDRRFISKSMEVYSKCNPDDYNMKLHLQENFLSKILDKQVIEVDHLGVVREKLKDMKVLIFIDDLDDQVVLDTLVGGDEWFGPGSRIIVITKDRQMLRGRGITCIYEVDIPSEKVALQIFCRSAFRQNSPPNGFMELASEVAMRVGGLPLGLNLLGSSLRGRKKKYWVDMLPTLQKGLDGKIEKALRVSYEGLERKEHKELFRHIACFFNGDEVNHINLILADSGLNVDIGLEILVDKSLIRKIPSFGTKVVEMHCLVEEMGKEIVRSQSNEPGQREFLMDSKEIYDVLKNNTGSKDVQGISLNIDEIDELRIEKKAFKGMHNLRFLKLYATKWGQKKEVRWHLPEDFDYLPPKLRLLRLDEYPMRCMPSQFCPENLVKLQMWYSKLEKLWDGVHTLTGLKHMNLRGSINLKEIPDLTMATNLEILDLMRCSSLVELPSSIQFLNKLTDLNMLGCTNLETLPTEMNLESLERLTLTQCSRLRTFPGISTNISMLILNETGIEEFPTNLRLENLSNLEMCIMKSEKLWERAKPLKPLMAMLPLSLKSLDLSDIPSLVELPSYIRDFNNLEYLRVTECINLKTLPTGINLQSLYQLSFKGCSRLKSFPDISTNISELDLSKTAIEEIPWWIVKFSWLECLQVNGCNNLQCVSFNISKLKHLADVDFSDCGALTEASWNDSPSAVAMITDDVHSELQQVPDEASSSRPDNCVPKVKLNFINCFNLDQEAMIQQQTVYQQLIFPGEEVPSYFTHRTNGTSLAVPLPHTSQPFFRFKACAVVDSKSFPIGYPPFDIQVSCWFRGRLGNHFNSAHWPRYSSKNKLGSFLVTFDCFFPITDDNAPLAEDNYDHVDIQFHPIDLFSCLKLKGCGIRLPEDGPSLDSQPCSPNNLPHVCEGDKINMVKLGGKHILRSHGVKCLHKMAIPSEKLALEMFYRSDFWKNSLPEAFMKLAPEVSVRAGALPLGLNLLGLSMRGQNKKYR